MTEENIPHGTEVTGAHGIAEPFDTPSAPATIAAYLVTAPTYHPLWSQYMLAVVSLADRSGMEPAHLQFPDATHELIVVALNPEAGHRTIADLCVPDVEIPYLQPVNIAHQFEATDEEMQQLAWLCGRGIVRGQLNPETGDAPALIRQHWLTSCVRTLAHIRGEEHAP